MKPPASLPYSHMVEIAHLHTPLALRLVPDEAGCAAIAQFAGLEAVRTFAAALDVVPMADGSVRVSGRLEADVRPVCVLTLEAFDEHVETPIEADFASADVAAKLARAAEAAEDENFEPPDEILDGRIDLGALAVEFLILALDPYPRKPGASFAPVQNAEPVSLFEKLKTLKLKPDET